MNNFDNVKGDEQVYLKELKLLAKKMLPTTSLLRSLILDEPDYLPKIEALVKAEVYARLLYEELGSDK